MTRDRREQFCGGVHAVTASLAMTMCGYNLLERVTRRERRLTLNATVYAGLFLWELRQTFRHWSRV